MKEDGSSIVKMQQRFHDLMKMVFRLTIRWPGMEESEGRVGHLTAQGVKV